MSLYSMLGGFSPMNYVVGMFVPSADFIANVVSSSGVVRSGTSMFGTTDWKITSMYLKCATYFVVRFIPSLLMTKVSTYTG